MAGSLDNPVVLDPWQAIVEVEWGARFLAVQFSIQRRDPNDNTWGWSQHLIACSPAVAVDPNKQYGRWLDSFQYQWGDNQEAPSSAYVYTNAAGWSDTTVPITALNGTPELPIVHSYAAQAVATIPTTVPRTAAHPRAVWVEPGADDYAEDIPLPLNPSERFEVVSTATIQINAVDFVGNVCHTLALGGNRAIIANDLSTPLTFSALEPTTVDFSAITITASGRQWQHVAAKVVHDTSATPTTAGSVWVLFSPVTG